MSSNKKVIEITFEHEGRVTTQKVSRHLRPSGPFQFESFRTESGLKIRRIDVLAYEVA